MAYYLGKQQPAGGTAGQQTSGQTTQAQAQILSSNPDCIKHCDSDLAECLVDASTFEEKQRCRDAAAKCRQGCGEVAPLITPPPSGLGVQGGVEGGVPGGGSGTPPPPPPAAPGAPPAGGAGGEAPTGGTRTPEQVALCQQECLKKGNKGGIDLAKCLSDCVKGGTLYHTCVAGSQCNGDADCYGGKCDGYRKDPVTGQETPGKCSCAGGTTEGCPEGVGKTYEGCPCGDGYSTLSGKCPAGYVFIRRTDPKDWKPGIPYKEGAVGTCQCQKAIDDWKAKQGGGEYQYPPGMQELMELLLGRGKSLIGMPLGYSQDALNSMFGVGYENVRSGERGERDAILNTLASQGMLGTGAQTGAVNQTSWDTENRIADLARQIFVSNEEKKKADLMDYTGLAQSLLGTGMGYEQLLEAINAARRGEGNTALMLYLELLKIFGGG